MAKIDAYNEQILRVLEKDGRVPNTELAEMIGLSPSACLRRVQELEKAGYIKGYKAVLNKEKLGIGFIAYVAVGLAEHSTASQLAFEKAIADVEGITECHNVTGPFEYLLRVETSDLHAFKSLHADVLGEILQVRTITTHVVMGSPKDTRL